MAVDLTNLQSLKTDVQTSDNEDYLYILLAEKKWKNGFVCRKCGHTHFCKGKKAGSRRCTKCKSEESATAHTIFHRCHLPIHEAFQLASAVCCKPDTSSYELSRNFDRRQMTCWKFRSHILECVNNPQKETILKELLIEYQLLTGK
jgi:hypothetical protein